MGGFVTAKVGSSDYLGATITLKEEIEKLPGVIKVDLIFGRYDVIAEMEINDLDVLSRLVTDKIQSTPNVLTTDLHMLIFLTAPLICQKKFSLVNESYVSGAG